MQHEEEPTIPGNPKVEAKASTATLPPGRLRKRIVIRGIWVLLLLPLAGWASLAVRFSPWPGAEFLFLLPLIGMLGPLVVPGSCRRAVCVSLLLFLAVLLAWSCMEPSNDRDWQPNVAQLASAQVDGNVVTVRNVRHCRYRSETDYDVVYETRVYPLDGIRSADLVMVNWGLKGFAHTMISFGFEDGRYLCFSIETRMEVGEEYSAVRGFFRNYELICLAADERDVIKLRTNYREHENVSIYRMKPKRPDVLRQVFLDYLDRLNELHDRPEWYNALTDNCMTGAYRIIRKHAVHAPLDWRIIFNEFAIDMAYEDGAVDTSLPLEEYRARSVVNPQARQAGDAEDFSRRIRQGLPGIAGARSNTKGGSR